MTPLRVGQHLRTLGKTVPLVRVQYKNHRRPEFVKKWKEVDECGTSFASVTVKSDEDAWRDVARGCQPEPPQCG